MNKIVRGDSKRPGTGETKRVLKQLPTLVKIQIEPRDGQGDVRNERSCKLGMALQFSLTQDARKCPFQRLEEKQLVEHKALRYRVCTYLVFIPKIQVLNAKTNKQKHLNCDLGKRGPWQKSMPHKQEALSSDPQNLPKSQSWYHKS